MKQLWAPWRMEYIQGEAGKGEGCVFCGLGDPSNDPGRLILRRGDHAFVLMNKFPYSNGHLMVAPYRHTCDPGVLSDVEALEMHRLLNLARDVLQEKFSPQGFNVGMNLGQIAGAGVTDHLHMHIVPRWSGDTNFMPVFADVRVIPQHLQATYDYLAPAFSKNAQAGGDGVNPAFGDGD
ncbi:HIT domain-containing protein [uncultured Desulfuromonas sp.]|uniref:HIT family protein n=1 Tax=uncultured Desulfuromonas sp. TaxID=181013 RepID=UPI002623DAA2|nr:HIT domain-containing protein [uncultured Desulfuromonas sp.]